MVIGIDEVGRGSLAGPLVAAAVRVYDRSLFPIDRVRDSKRLSDEQRRELVPELLRSCVVGYGLVSHRLIDRIGIQNANVLAFELAVHQLFEEGVDIHADQVGVFHTYASAPWDITFHIRGESAVPEIAAASICAKVYRDDLMLRHHEQFPRYHFAEHKGYGTPDHFAALRAHGRSPIHRMSFTRFL